MSRFFWTPVWPWKTLLPAASAGPALGRVNLKPGRQVLADEPVAVDGDAADDVVVLGLGQPPHVFAGAAGKLGTVSEVNVLRRVDLHGRQYCTRRAVVNAASQQREKERGQAQ